MIQNQIQDKNLQIQEDNLSIGTVVLIKKEGLLGKLETRFTNKCTVVGVDSNKNYKLINELGEIMNDLIPRHKLKVIIESNSKEGEDEGEVVEVQKILNHRKN